MKTLQKGFTLIELIVVIVILGILAATALPKFIDLSGDARRGVMQAVEASMRGANMMVYGKSASLGKLGTNETFKINNVDVSTVCGYLAAASMAGQLELSPTGDFDTATAGTVKHSKAPDPDKCKVTYAPPALASGACSANNAPTYTTDFDGC